MTTSELLGFAKNFYQECEGILSAKNADYNGKGQDALSNFRAVEQYGISTEAGFITRMSDKMKRIASLVEKGKQEVKDESIIDTLQDLANYSLLLAA